MPFSLLGKAKSHFALEQYMGPIASNMFSKADVRFQSLGGIEVRKTEPENERGRVQYGLTGEEDKLQ